MKVGYTIFADLPPKLVTIAMSLPLSDCKTIVIFVTSTHMSINPENLAKIGLAHSEIIDLIQKNKKHHE